MGVRHNNIFRWNESMIPSEEGLVGPPRDEPVLQIFECNSAADPIDGNHTDAEDTQHGVHPVFLLGRLSLGHPDHFLRYAHARRNFTSSKDIGTNPRALGDRNYQVLPSPDEFPVFRKEPEEPGYDELLKGPASREPVALGEFGGIADVVQVRVADGRLAIPSVHRIDHLRELHVVPPVDATGVQPNIVERVSSRLGAGTVYLVVAHLLVLRALGVANVSEEDFF